VTETFDLDSHRRERARQRERDHRMLTAERRRLERILAAAVGDLAAQPGSWVRLMNDGELVEVPVPSPTEVLEQLAWRIGCDLSRPAWVEEQEREATEAERRERYRLDDEAHERFFQAWESLA
jgi:P2-related tail formation protein